MRMKSLVKYVFLALVVAFVSGCTRELSSETEADYIPVRLELVLPDGSATRANVNYGSETVTTLWLLCFNQVNSCVGCVKAVVSGTSVTVSPGIPRESRSIHFIGNKDLSARAGSVIGQQEQSVLESLVSSASDPVAFWGWFHGNTVGEVKNFVDASTPNTIYLLRDRAKLHGGSIADSDIDFIEWTVSRRLEEGYVAPYPFENYYEYDSVNVKFVGTTTVTPKSNASRYSVQESDFVLFGTDLYLFEDANTFEDLGNLVKIVLKVTYTNTHVRYHNVVIMDDDYVTIPVVRSHTYTFNVNSLPENMGYASLAEALAAEVFSNNYFISIDRDVDEVTDGTYSLSIDDPQGTYILYQVGVSKAIQFTYKENGLPETGRTVDHFHAMWLENDGLVNSDSEPILSYDPSTGIGAVVFSLRPIDESLHHGLLLLQDTEHGLSRFIEIYAISKFHYEIDPELTKVDGKTHNGHQVYKFSLTLRPDFPACFLPINLPFASMTLSPYSDSSPDAASGTFSVSVTSTSELNGTGSVTSPYDWNYKAEEWGFWYNYSFIPDMSTSAGRTATIYLEDVTSAREGMTFNSVGLYLKMPRFGGIINDFDDALHLNI